MSDKLQNTSMVKVDSFLKGMNKDYDSMYVGDGFWTNAINAINVTHFGDRGHIGNEPSNKECASTKYTIIGYAHKNNNEIVLFSTNNDERDGNGKNDIGIYNIAKNEYESIFEDNDNRVCLNFSVVDLITAVVKENYDHTHSVYWADGYNPDRYINLDIKKKIGVGEEWLLPDRPYHINQSQNPCDPIEYTNELNCEKLRIHPLVTDPCVRIAKSQSGGQLINGSYMAVVAYSDNEMRLTSYSMPSAAVGIWQHEGIGGSIEIVVSNLDHTLYNEFELVVIAVNNQQTSARRIGYYPTGDNVTIHLDQINQDLPNVPLSYIPLKNMVYDKSDKMYELNNHLVRCGVTGQPYINYQPKANDIITKYVVVQYRADYYYQGGVNVGYMRDEVYSFFIRGVFDTGARTPSYHIPGRKHEGNEKSSISDSNTLSGESERWQVYDTSYVTDTGVYDYPSDNTDQGHYIEKGKVIRKGKMGYWESTEQYPDNHEVWGDDLCNEHIRHHKMPSDEKEPISERKYTPDNTYIDYINVLGVQFENIAPFTDDNNIPIPGIIGYEILRGSREGNKSIIAKGMFNNMLSYGNPGDSKAGLVQNYPYNDVREDPFLVKNYNNMINASANPGHLTSDYYKKHIFSFHSPETTFLKPYIGSGYIKLSRLITGKENGRFKYVYKHPEHKLISNAAFTAALVLGIGIGVLSAMGTTNLHSEKELSAIVATTRTGGDRSSGAATGLSDLIFSFVEHGFGLFSGGTGIFALIAGVAVMLANFMYFFGEGVGQVLDVIRNISSWQQYAVQYDSHGDYYKWYRLKDIIRREIKTSKYIGSHIQDLDNKYSINNINRNKYVAIKVKNIPGIPFPSEYASEYGLTDKSKHLIDRDNNDNHKINIDKDYNSTISSYYGSIKINYKNQYGKLNSIVQIPTHSCVYHFEGNNNVNSGIIFGGDTYINRYTEKNPYMFFNTWQYDVPNGTEFNYRNYVNGPVPCYWADFNKYDLSDFQINGLINNIDNLIESGQAEAGEYDPTAYDEENAGEAWGESGMGSFDTSPPTEGVNLPSNFHNLDGGTGSWIKKAGCFYHSYNGVRDFFCESEMNLAYRDYGEEIWEKFYDVTYENHYNNLDMMFRSDLITKPIYHKYDMSLSVFRTSLNAGSWGKMLPSHYNEKLFKQNLEYLPNRVVYSLQQQEGVRKDNWLNYLPLNFKDFKSKVSVIKSLNTTGAVLLFEKSEPIYFPGVDQLQTKDGMKFVVGDGGLFANASQSMVNADDELGYGHCISSRSAINTPYGLFWISQNSGKIFNFVGGQVDDITRYGMTNWFFNNLPSHMLKQYPEYPHYDNPVIGVGCQAVYDPQYKLIYFSKKDYYLHEDNSNLLFNRDNPYFRVGSSYQFTFSLDKIFEDASWVASYDPERKMWISFHTWKPSFLIPSYDHFFSVDSIKDSAQSFGRRYNLETSNTLWKHNDRTDSFCVYYDEPSYWEIEYPISTPNNVNTLRNIEYILECYRLGKYKHDSFHILDENFDKALIYNSEQVSGWLNLNIKEKQNPYANLVYPRLNEYGYSYDIMVAKEENKYRFNQFWDIVKDRGEYSHLEQPFFKTRANGFEKDLVINTVDYNKFITDRKKFRHYETKVILKRTINDEKNKMPKMILKLANNKLLNSLR